MRHSSALDLTCLPQAVTALPPPLHPSKKVEFRLGETTASKRGAPAKHMMHTYDYIASSSSYDYIA
jgi:hypothetical protein